MLVFSTDIRPNLFTQSNYGLELLLFFSVYWRTNQCYPWRQILFFLCKTFHLEPYQFLLIMAWTKQQNLTEPRHVCWLIQINTLSGPDYVQLFNQLWRTKQVTITNQTCDGISEKRGSIRSVHSVESLVKNLVIWQEWATVNGCSSCHQLLLNHILAKLGGNSSYSCKRTKMLFPDSVQFILK